MIEVKAAKGLYFILCSSSKSVQPLGVLRKPNCQNSIFLLPSWLLLPWLPYPFFTLFHSTVFLSPLSAPNFLCPSSFLMFSGHQKDFEKQGVLVYLVHVLQLTVHVSQCFTITCHHLNAKCLSHSLLNATLPWKNTRDAFWLTHDWKCLQLCNFTWIRSVHGSMSHVNYLL